MKNGATALRNRLSILLLSLLFIPGIGLLFPGTSLMAQTDGQVFSIHNGTIQLSVSIDQNGYLSKETIRSNDDWASGYHTPPFEVSTDGNFAMGFMWTAWSAPGKSANADDEVTFTARDFRSDGTTELELIFAGRRNPLQVAVTYRLDPDAFFVRRKVSVRNPRAESVSGGHYLQWIRPLDGTVLSQNTIIKEGGFGQPVALLLNSTPGTGAFFGLEYPTAVNTLSQEPNKTALRCSQYLGERIGPDWTSGEWMVEGLSPEPEIKQWFMRYVNTIRIAPLRPFLLYNSWYDLRAPELVKDPNRVMNEKNVLHSIDAFQQNLTRKRGVSLDAFVLDDGWDVYKSDWKLSKKQFPHGFKPITRRLASMGTSLGIWFGPIGGYSHRNWRVDWMKAHGYETVGDQMCIAGTNYHQLFKKRVTDFVKNDKMGYYKWDGIQFSCSEPDHGHQVGVYSRRDIMQSVIDLSNAVRKENPNIFLNTTSGTWLSPWWVKYSNTIWMQGSDYGYSDVPSISHRDAAITYRDYVLYDDLRAKDLWFPLSNLMTHGIIKGRLQSLGTRAEPLDKFTNNALLYFARGVSMWELYISPDLLTEQQWDALAQSIKWAKHNFDLLQHTELIGGDPGAGEPYGYVHFQGNHGIVVVRNPVMNPQSIELQFTHTLGLDTAATNLVMERIYPDRWIAPTLYGTGDATTIPLEGYETAMFEIYPIKEATQPLLAGADFDMTGNASGGSTLHVLKVVPGQGGARLLNPDQVTGLTVDGSAADADGIIVPVSSAANPVHDITVHSGSRTTSSVRTSFQLDSNVTDARIACLLQVAHPEQAGDVKSPQVGVTVNGAPVEAEVENQDGQWGGYTVPVSPGKNEVAVQVSPGSDGTQWQGSANLWLIYRQQPTGHTMTVQMAGQTSTSARVLPPSPWQEGTLEQQVQLGSAAIATSIK
ncbi:MAG: alpha-galactosidase [Calditrichota bacterium]